MFALLPFTKINIREIHKWVYRIYINSNTCKQTSAGGKCDIWNIKESNEMRQHLAQSVQDQ